MELHFYTRNGCILCDDAKSLLMMFQEEFGFTLHEIDIETNDELTELYGLRIPVVESNGEVIQEGIIDLGVIEEYVKNFHTSR